MSIHKLTHIALVISLAAFTANLARAQEQLIPARDARIQYEGRTGFTDSTAQLTWTAACARIRFRGTGVQAILKDETGVNSYNVVIDGKVAAVIYPDTTKSSYVLAKDLAPREHIVEIFKRTEGVMGKTLLFGLRLDSGSILLAPPQPHKRKIEVFGDSITCGYADEDTAGKDRGTAPYENGYLSYASIIARHYKAQLYCTARSGIGITISWFPQVMPEMYDLIDPNDSTRKWNFSEYTPDLVIINLFQNDCWLTTMPQHEQFKARFGTTAPTADDLVEAYSRFLKNVRKKYPRAKILCILGSMDATKQGSPWPGYVEKAVAGLHDKSVYTHFVPFKNTPGHPSVKEQQAMADDLIAYINRHILW